MHAGGQGTCKTSCSDVNFGRRAFNLNAPLEIDDAGSGFSGIASDALRRRLNHYPNAKLLISGGELWLVSHRPVIEVKIVIHRQGQITHTNTRIQSGLQCLGEKIQACNLARTCRIGPRGEV